MKSLRTAVLLCATLLLCCPFAHAQEEIRLRNALSGLAAMSNTTCPRMQKNMDRAEAEGTVRDDMAAVYQNLCVCVPAQIDALRSSLSPAELQAMVTEEKLKSLLLDRVMGKCAAELVRTLYTGAACVKRAAAVRPQTESYCKCMSERLATVPDREQAEMGIAASEYVPLAADAEKKGLPAPEPPPMMKKFRDIEQACSGK
jgi:hypothetical protein